MRHENPTTHAAIDKRKYPRGPFTDLAVRNLQPALKPDGTYRTVWFHDGGGLYLEVSSTPSGHINRHWHYRYSVKGKDRKLSLGPYPQVSLSRARDLAEQQRRLRKEQRKDPIAERRRLDHERELAEEEAAQAASVAKARSVSFSQAAHEYLTTRKPEWGTKYADQWTALINAYATPIIGSTAVADIDTDLVHKVLAPLWFTKTVTAQRLRNMLAKMLSWCANKPSQPYRPKGPNPATWEGNLEYLLPKPSKITKGVTHRPALPWQDIREFMTTLCQDNSTEAHALEFAILTGGRTKEVRLAPWSEINLKHRTWEIPAKRMKATRPHRVPLCNAAMEILIALKGDSTPTKRDYVFSDPTGRPLSEKALRRACHRITPSVSVHGMRSTFREWVSANTKFPRELAELAVAHRVKGDAEAAYWRDDALEKRRPMMEAWGRFCVPAKTAKVIPFTAA